MHVKAKYKVCRRLGPGVYDKCQSDTYILRESRKTQGKRGPQGRRRSRSEYNKQLLEKQKVRFTYGISERQFRRYVNEALKTRGTETASLLYTLLENRLDNVVYRLGLAPTRRSARQLVSHGHVLVNGKRMKVPSHQVRKGDHVTVREESRTKRVFENRQEEMEKHEAPGWLVYDMKAFDGTILGDPSVDEAIGIFDFGAVLEFYSR